MTQVASVFSLAPIEGTFSRLNRKTDFFTANQCCNFFPNTQSFFCEAESPNRSGAHIWPVRFAHQTGPRHYHQKAWTFDLILIPNRIFGQYARAFGTLKIYRLSHSKKEGFKSVESLSKVFPRSGLFITGKLIMNLLQLMSRLIWAVHNL